MCVCAGRQEILQTHMQKQGLPLGADVTVGSIAASTTGFTGADLANLVNEAALLAGRSDKGVLLTKLFRFSPLLLPPLLLFCFASCAVPPALLSLLLLLLLLLAGRADKGVLLSLCLFYIESIPLYFLFFTFPSSFSSSSFCSVFCVFLLPLFLF